jgi:hypothetical protein
MPIVGGSELGELGVALAEIVLMLLLAR